MDNRINNVYGFRCARCIYENMLLLLSKECNVSREQIKSLVPKQWSKLLDSQLLKADGDHIRIKWLDEQFEERKAAHIKRVNAGRKGGKTTQNKQAQAMLKH